MAFIQDSHPETVRDDTHVEDTTLAQTLPKLVHSVKQIGLSISESKLERAWQLARGELRHMWMTLQWSHVTEKSNTLHRNKTMKQSLCRSHLHIRQD